jgi:hypothetical protein
VGPVSAQCGTSSGCGWRRRSSDLEGAANILNKQSRAADKEFSSTYGVVRRPGGGLTTLSMLRYEKERKNKIGMIK